MAHWPFTTTTLRIKFYFPHFIDWKTQAPTITKVTQMRYNQAGIYTEINLGQIISLQAQILPLSLITTDIRLIPPI